MQWAKDSLPGMVVRCWAESRESGIAESCPCFFCAPLFYAFWITYEGFVLGIVRGWWQHVIHSGAGGLRLVNAQLAVWGIWG